MSFPYSASPQKKIDITADLQHCQQLASQGQLNEAIGLTRQLSQKYPKLLGPYELMADFLRRAGQGKEAIEPLRALVQLDSKNHLRFTDVASLYHELNDMPNAERHARQALALNPFNAQAHNLLGMIYLRLQQSEEAEFHFRQLLLLHEPLAPIMANLAAAYKGMGRLDQAETYFRYCLQLDEKNIEGLLAWVRMEEARRQSDRAWELLKQAEELATGHPGVNVARSVLLRREKDYQGALASIDACEAKHVDKMAAYHYERGDVLDKLERYDEAFASYQRANQLIIESGKGTYQAEKMAGRVERLKNFFVRDRIEPVQRNLASAKSLDDLAKPIFIIGFPRSGTTLTEQILTSHPNISAGDELDYMSRLTRLSAHMSGSQLNYPTCLEELGKPEKADFINKFRSYYVVNAELRGIIEKGTKRFTDKMPLNEMHMGLIHLVFPDSPMVHLIRHPLDVVLSTYFNDLTHGGFCSYQLETAARHYMLMFDLIAHYRKELNVNYMAIRYEDIVDEPEPSTRSLLEFVGEPFDEACVAFHKNKRYARTASYAQVSEKLYTRSRFRYKHYLEGLQPVIPILQPAIEQLGYEI